MRPDSKLEDYVFRDKVEDALEKVKRILDVHRNPGLAEDAEHQYEDKYRLVDQMTNTALIGLLNIFMHFGLTSEVLKSIDKSKPVTLRFQASDSCTYVKEKIVDVPMERMTETYEVTKTSTVSSFFGSTTKSTVQQVVHQVKEYHWKIDMNWEFSIYSGTNVNAKKVLKERSSSQCIILQSNKRSPIPEHRECKPLELPLTWLMSQFDTESMTARFGVNRQDPKTKTPRRNEQVEQAVYFMQTLASWTAGVRAYFNKCIQKDIIDIHSPAGPVPRKHEDDRLTSLSSDGLFVPVQPLLENGVTTTSSQEFTSQSIMSFASFDDETSGSTSPLLTMADMHKFLNEQIRCMEECITNLKSAYPNHIHTDVLVSYMEASIVLLTLHFETLMGSYVSAVNYVETMLRKQLFDAVGKSLDGSDIDKFVRYHNATLLDPPPEPFCYAIREEMHYPSGMLSIESGDHEPIETMKKDVEVSSPFCLPLNAAATVELTGKTFLHGWIQHRFGHNRSEFNLVARARQFSSFLLVVGTIGHGTLEPKDAIILQNKDDVIIPLLLEEIPTSKEFKDAIQSLSPEQQRFAAAFRNMQLGSSVLGVCVIQIKPQLEYLLGLPPDALTKEIKLTQDLLELFVKYQIPSDLLSYDGTDPNASTREKVGIVKKHVDAILDVIDKEKHKQLEEQKLKAGMAHEARIAERGVKIAEEHGFESPMCDHDWSSDKPEDALWKKNEPLYCWNGVQPGSNQELVRPAFDWSKSTPERDGGVAEEHGSETFEEPQSRSSVIDKFNASASTEPSTQLQSMSNTFGTIGSRGTIDLTAVPQALNKIIEERGDGVALRSTVIKRGDSWKLKRQENLLKEPKQIILHQADFKTEKNKAIDLLDALSRSGSLPISFSELHVIVAVTHCFKKDVIGTIIEDSINPIEKLEMSALLVGSAIHGVPTYELLKSQDDIKRLQGYFPKLIDTMDSLADGAD